MYVLEILKGARELLTDPTHWCQRWYARTATGETTASCAEDAAQWCALGAISRASEGEESGSNRRRAADVLAMALGFLPADYDLDDGQGWRLLPDWNDTVTHADVLAGFDAAIAGLEGSRHE